MEYPMIESFGVKMNMNRTIKGTLAAALFVGMVGGAAAQADNTNSKIAPANDFSGWMTDYSKANQGRISRDAYMQEAGRRWDTMDKDKQGLTVDQINRTYGYGSMDKRPGAMGPGNVKGN